MGEIGRDRREYLYEMNWWEILLIIRGYMRRDVLKLQLLRMTAYHSLYAMRENKSGKTPDQLWPLYFDRYKTPDTPPPISDQEVQQLQAEMAAINAAGNPFAQ